LLAFIDMRIYFSLWQIEELSGLDKVESLKRHHLGLTVVKSNYPLLSSLPSVLSVLGALTGPLLISKSVHVQFGGGTIPDDVLSPTRLLIPGLGMGIGAGLGGVIGLQFLAAKLRLSLRQLFG
jgi:hypothetical protein